MVALAGHILSFRRHRRRWILAAAAVSALAVFAGLYMLGSQALIYAGFAALMALSLPELWAFVRDRLERPGPARLG